MHRSGCVLANFDDQGNFIPEYVQVVGDSGTVRQVLQLTPGNAGSDVIETEDGSDALEKLVSPWRWVC